MISDLDTIYTREWYEHDFAELEAEFDLAANGLDRWLRGWGSTEYHNAKYALDVGCGPGLLMQGLNRLGWYTSGFDGSAHARQYAIDHGIMATVQTANILDAPKAERLSIAICTEVAEHLDAKDAPTLVRYLTSHATKAIVFTAATPGQGGHDHRNEQPPEYWILEFLKLGWIRDVDGTMELRSRWHALDRLSHMTRTVTVFR